MILHVVRIIFVVFEVLVLFNLLIVVHELGHFLAARWRGLYIEKFGIWFGKPLWKKTINGVQYSLGSLAFGGPLCSFLLAVVFAIMIWAIGRPVSESEATTTIGYVMPESPAAQAGLQAGDKILAVDGHRVTRF